MSEPVGNSPRVTIPGNSHKEREAAQVVAEPREKVDKIVQGTVVTRKQPWYRRAAQNMIADDAQTIGDYILVDVIVPTMKNMLRDVVVGSIDRALYGSTMRSGARMGGGFGLRGNINSIRTKYENMSVGSGSGNEMTRRALSRDARVNHNFEEVFLDSREEAIAVVTALIGRIDQYGSATVSDLYDLCGITGTFADQRWGWKDLRDADVRQYRGSWHLDLPQPVSLRN